jgi:hypothetical protein
MRRKLVDFNVTVEQLDQMFGPSNDLTVKSWTNRWLDNVIDNLRLVPTPRPLSQLLTNINYHTMIACGAGPSLRKLKRQAPLIPKNWGIVTTDYGLLAVLQAGLKPSLVVSMDGHQETEPDLLAGFHMLNEMYPETPVVLDIVTCPSVVELTKNPFFFRSMGPHTNLINRFVMQECGHVDQMGHGGNVGSVCCIMAKFFCFARHVVLIGFDSAMKEGTTRGNYWNGKKALDGHQYVQVCDIYGRPITTMANLHNYKWWLDHFCWCNDDVEWINANDGGFLGVCGPTDNYNHYKYMTIKQAVEHLKDHGEDD